MTDNKEREDIIQELRKHHIHGRRLPGLLADFIIEIRADERRKVAEEIKSYLYNLNNQHYFPTYYSEKKFVCISDLIAQLNEKKVDGWRSQSLLTHGND